MAGAPKRSQIYRLANASENAPSEQPYGLANYNPENPRGNEFPVRFLPTDDYDTDWKIKDDLDKSGNISSSRPLPITERDISYIKRKRNDEEFAAFQTWIGTKYDLTDPAQQQMFKSIYPAYFEQREALINEQIDITSRYAKIRLNGASSEEDLMLQWEIETGRTILPQGPVWDPQTWIKNQARDAATQQRLGLTEAQVGAGNGELTGMQMVNYNKAVYKAGIFSPLKPVSIGKGGLEPNFNNRADIVGTPNTNYVGPLGGFQPSGTDYGVQYGGRNLVDRRSRAPTFAARTTENIARAATANTRYGLAGPNPAMNINNLLNPEQ
mgnify:CR=1 FL=1